MQLEKDTAIDTLEGRMQAKAGDWLIKGARVQVQDDTDEVTDPLIELLEQWAADDSADEEWPALERILFENGWITEETDDGD